MVLLTLDKPYTVHARSIDRNGTGQSPSNYKLSLRNAIKCNDNHYIRASLVSAKVPSTFYQIDSKNNTFTVGFNRPTFTLAQQYASLAVQDPDYKPLAGTATFASGSTAVLTTSDLRASVVDKIYVFSPTWSNDDKTARCRIPDEQIFEDVDDYEEIIQEILDAQEEDIREDGKDDADNILLIFSDLAGTKFYSNKKGILNKVAFNHRHYKVSVILDSQSLRQISAPFRNNLSGVMFFASISNRLEIKKILEEFIGQYNEKQARQILKYAFDGSLFNFLYLNFQKRTLYKNFNRLTINTNDDHE